MPEANEIFQSRWTTNMEKAYIPVPQGGQSVFNQQAYVYDPHAELIEEESIAVKDVATKDIRRGTLANVQEDVDVTIIGAARRTSKIYPLVKTRGLVSAAQLNKRLLAIERPGVINEAMGIQQRANYWASRIAKIDFGRIARLAEIMTWEVLQSGQLVTANGTLNYHRHTQLKGKTASKAWSAADADVLGDLGKSMKRIRQFGKTVSGTPLAIMGETAFRNFKAALEKKNDRLNIRIVDINMGSETVPSELGFLESNGLEYHGWVVTPFGARKIHIFTYPQWYDNNASGDSTTPYLGDDTAIVMFNNAQYFQMYYGPSEGLPIVDPYIERTFGDFESSITGDPVLTIGRTFIPAEAYRIDLATGIEGSGIKILSQLAPMPMMHQSDAVISVDTSQAGSPV